MDKKQVDALVEQSGTTDKAFLLKAKEKAKGKMDANPTAANVAAFERAKKALEDCVASEKNAKSEGKRQDILENANQVLLYIQGQGRKVGKGKIYKAVADGANGGIKPRRGGGFSKRVVDTWARANAPLKVNPAPTGDAPVEGGGEPGAATLKVERQASLLEVQTKLQEIKLRKEQGEVVPKADVERELASRAQAFRYGLEGWGNEVAAEVAALFGAEECAALEIITLVGGDPEKVKELQGWMQRRESELVALVQDSVERFLEPYARGVWWTENMARAMGMGTQPESEDGGTSPGA